MDASRTAPLSIGLVLHDFALGGTERIAVRLATRWAEAGARVTLFCGSAEGPMRALLGGGVCVTAAARPIARGRGSRWRLARAAARHFAAAPVDVVFLPGNFHWPVAPALAALPRAVRPAIVAQVSAALSKPQRRPFRQRLFAWRMRRLLRGADAVVAMTPAAAAEAEAMLRRAIVATITLPALPDATPPPLPVPADDRLILAAGRLVPEKGFDLLIDAFARLSDPAARLAIVGEGPDRVRLARRIAALGLGARVSLPGYAADIRGWLDAARLFVMPSRFEGYGAVLVEAFAAGRPAIGTAGTPAAVELITRADEGRIVPVDDLAALADAIAAMLAAPPPDPGGLAAKVARHGIGPVAERYRALFAEVAARRG